MIYFLHFIGLHQGQLVAPKNTGLRGRHFTQLADLEVGLLIYFHQFKKNVWCSCVLQGVAFLQG